MAAGDGLRLQRDDGQRVGPLAPWYSQTWFRQIVWYVLGTGAAVGFCCVDYHTLARWSLVVYWAAMLMLVAGVVPRHGARWGARRWFDLGLFSCSPPNSPSLPSSWPRPIS